MRKSDVIGEVRTAFIFFKEIDQKCSLITVFLPLKRDGVSQTFNIATIVEK